MSTGTSTCPTWCLTSQNEHDFEADHGVALIHSPGHHSYQAEGIEVGFSIERHTEPDGRNHDLIWIESDVVEVVNAEAFARAILDAIGAKR